MLELGDSLTLDDNKVYVVSALQAYNNEHCVFLVDEDDHNNNLYCKLKKEGLEEVIDPEIIEKLILLFNKEINEN